MKRKIADSLWTMRMDVRVRVVASCLGALMLGLPEASAATHTWANSNVAGATPASPLDWFTGGPNTQGVWTGGTPVADSWGGLVNFFQDTTTPLGNTGAGGNAQTANVNKGGVPFVLRFVTFGGKASETPGANLTMTLAGDPLHFSNTTSPQSGTMDVRGVDNVQTLSYAVNNPILIGTASTGVQLLVQGGGTAVLTLAGPISELRPGGGKVTKQGNSTLCLAGNNAFSGGVNAQGGTIRLTGMNSSGTNVLSLTSGNTIFDLTAGNDRWSGGPAVPKPVYMGGTLTVRGATSGVSSQTLDGPQTGFAQSTIIVDPNGGAGTTLTLGSTWSAGAQIGSLFIDRSAPGAVVRSARALDQGIISMGNWGNATVIVKDATGTGFATTNASGEVVRYTGASPLLPGSNSYFTNYKTSGSLTLNAGAHNTYTLELDATDGPGLLDLGKSKLSGKFLMAGANDFTIQNGTNSFGGWLHQFGAGTLTVSAIVVDEFRKSGPGRLVLSGANTFSGATGLTIEDGVVQALEGSGLPVNTVLRVYGGVFQSSGSMTRTVNSESPYTTPKVAWRAWNANPAGRGGGFAAQGGTLTVNLNAGAVLAWGSGAFVQTSQTLVLGSTSADSLLDWQNGIDLGNTLPSSSPSGSTLMRAVQVDDNPASVTDIAQFSGVLSGSVGGLLKTGDGTLRLIAPNTYGGPTDVNAGTLLVNGSLSAASAPVTVNAGGTLGGTGTVNRTVTAYAGGTLMPGNNGTGTLTAASTVTVHGAIAMAGTAGLTCGASCVVGPGASMAWGAGATGRVTVNGTLTLPSAASVSFAAAPAGSLVLFESPNAIVGSPAAWTVTPATVALRVSTDGKQVLASVAGGTLVLVR